VAASSDARNEDDCMLRSASGLCRVCVVYIPIRSGMRAPRDTQVLQQACDAAAISAWSRHRRESCCAEYSQGLFIPCMHETRVLQWLMQCLMFPSNGGRFINYS